MVQSMLVTLFVFCVSLFCCSGIATKTQPMCKIPIFNAILERSQSVVTLFKSIRSFDKESNRKLRRTVFAAEDWKSHRSSARYFKELRKMPSSLVLRSLTVQALTVCLWSAFVVFFNQLAELKPFKLLLPLLSFPSLPVSLTSPSLGLLLVFRTNGAYDRWKKARMSWATISAKSFDLMRQACLWIDNEALKACLVRHVCALSKCLKWYLGQHSDRRLREDLSGVLSTSEVDNVMSSRDRCKFILMKISLLITEAKLIANVQSCMDKGVCDLTSEMCTCDFIYTSPIPLVYTRHTARFLLLWLLAVPMALYDEFRARGAVWYVPLITFFHSIFLFGIEDLGVQVGASGNGSEDCVRRSCDTVVAC